MMLLVEGYKDQDEIRWTYPEDHKEDFLRTCGSLAAKGYRVEAFEVTRQDNGEVGDFTAVYVSDWED
jgi:hypothetical protein